MIPKIENLLIWPVKALQKMWTEFQGSSNLPLFVSNLGVVTQTQVRSHEVLRSLNLDTSLYSFHTFRRSGTALAFDNNVNLSLIQRQGTWTSSAVNAYIVSDPDNASVVASTFRSLLST